MRGLISNSEIFRCGFSINEDIFIITSMVFVKLAFSKPLYPSKSGESGSDFNESATISSVVGSIRVFLFAEIFFC